jgi:hypothetical protein
VKPLVVAFGGGVNSTAMLVEFQRRAIRPEVILFADTGGERPETYVAVAAVSSWCVANNFPAIETVKHHGGPHKDSGLEAECVRIHALPSIAYGWKKCSDKWKRRPQDAWLKANGLKDYRKAIGFDAGEERRAKFDGECWYPLIEWNIWREECEAICVQAGLPVEKSSCFFCPSMRKAEILALAKSNPDLMDRALAMERGAELISMKGLGRRFAWADLVRAEAAQLPLFDSDAPEIPCGCYDG